MTTDARKPNSAILATRLTFLLATAACMKVLWTKTSEATSEADEKEPKRKSIVTASAEVVVDPMVATKEETVEDDSNRMLEDDKNVLNSAIVGIVSNKNSQTESANTVVVVSKMMPRRLQRMSPSGDIERNRRCTKNQNDHQENAKTDSKESRGRLEG
jgi:predicted house-cleaning NTP pyrophosphatase (Maf/HAM1 superfamily)